MRKVALSMPGGQRKGWCKKKEPRSGLFIYIRRERRQLKKVIGFKLLWSMM